LNGRFNQRHLSAGKALVLVHRRQDVSRAATVGNEMRSLFGAARVQLNSRLEGVVSVTGVSEGT
jgi:hypothetical protein